LSVENFVYLRRISGQRLRYVAEICTAASAKLSFFRILSTTFWAKHIAICPLLVDAWPRKALRRRQPIRSTNLFFHTSVFLPTRRNFRQPDGEGRRPHRRGREPSA